MAICQCCNKEVRKTRTFFITPSQEHGATSELCGTCFEDAMDMSQAIRTQSGDIALSFTCGLESIQIDLGNMGKWTLSKTVE